MNKQQTAVEWLIDWMGKNQYFIGNDLLDAYKQAKEMEKQQIIDAVTEGWDSNENGLVRWIGEQYYNETYFFYDTRTS